MIIPFKKQDIAIDILVPICPYSGSLVGLANNRSQGLLSAVLLQIQ
jgi:hypothetical protein